MSELRADPQQEPQILKRLHVYWRRRDDKLDCRESEKKKNAGRGRKQSSKGKERERERERTHTVKNSYSCKLISLYSKCVSVCVFRRGREELACRRAEERVRHEAEARREEKRMREEEERRKAEEEKAQRQREEERRLQQQVTDVFINLCIMVVLNSPV